MGILHTENVEGEAITFYEEKMDTIGYWEDWTSKVTMPYVMIKMDDYKHFLGYWKRRHESLPDMVFITLQEE